MAYFTEVARVLEHPRCMNCHPQGDRPRQGETGQFKWHEFNVVRGPDDHGPPGLPCKTCHGPDNFDPGGVPGHEKWGLAPASMGWIGLSSGEICRAILDPDRNGGKSLPELVHHLAEDPLVGWAWNPGLRPDGTPRELPPMSWQQFGAAAKNWARTGAHCPE